MNTLSPAISKTVPFFLQTLLKPALASLKPREPFFSWTSIGSRGPPFPLPLRSFGFGLCPNRRRARHTSYLLSLLSPTSSTAFFPSRFTRMYSFLASFSLFFFRTFFFIPFSHGFLLALVPRRGVRVVLRRWALKNLLSRLLRTPPQDAFWGR